MNSIALEFWPSVAYSPYGGMHADAQQETRCMNEGMALAAEVETRLIRQAQQ
jgi:hypothetical protein